MSLIALLSIVLGLTAAAFVGGLRLGRRRLASAPECRAFSPPPAGGAPQPDENAAPFAAAEKPQPPLPAAEISPSGGAPPHLPASDISPTRLAVEGKIMIVDDEPINIKVVQKYLKLAGYQHITGVSDPYAVLGGIAREQPDLVLLDVMMPGVSGLEILSQIRADDRWAFLPVIIVTAADNEQTKLKALELGATDFLAKPVNGTELAPRVRNALLIKAHHDYLKHYARELERQTRQLEAQIAQARTDPLTGLVNRRALDEELQRRFAERKRTGSPLSVLLIDVDRFKDFNDLHGHRAGDEALRVISGALRGTMRHVDMVARYGGDEFLVMLPGTTIDGAKLVAERTRQDISRTCFRYDGKNLGLTVSVGVAQLDGGEQIARLLQRADHAMYASKSAGCDRTYWHDGRATRPVVEQPAAEQPAVEQSAAEQSAAEQSAAEWSVADHSERRAAPSSAPLTPEQDAFAPSAAPPGCEALRRGTGGPLDRLPAADRLLGDHRAFLACVRQRIAEWKRGGSTFCVGLFQLAPRDTAPGAAAQEPHQRSMRLAARMVGAVTREMDLIARYEQDCFSILLPHVALEQGVGVLRRVEQSLEMSDLGSSHARLPLISRIGVAEVAEGDDPLGLFQRALAALRSEQDRGGAGPAQPAPASFAPAVCFDPPATPTQQTGSAP